MRSLTRVLTGVVTALAAARLLTSCMLFARAPEDRDYSRTSEGGAYRATIIPQGDSIPQGKLQRWTLHLEAAAGGPADSAAVSSVMRTPAPSPEAWPSSTPSRCCSGAKRRVKTSSRSRESPSRSSGAMRAPDSERAVETALQALFDMCG